MKPYVPPAWIGRESEFPWPEWEHTCPGCGRFTRHFHFVSGEMCRCAHCGWMGDLPAIDLDSIPTQDGVEP